MKTRLTFTLIAALLLAPVVVRAEDAPAARPKLAIVVVENLSRRGGAITDFDRLDIAFHKVAKERNWPFEIEAERFAANTPDHETELQIFNQPVREETPGELTFRGWMTLKVNGEKHDFGIVLFRLYPRAGENISDTLDKVFLGVARKAADKMEPILFPKEEGKPAS